MWLGAAGCGAFHVVVWDTAPAAPSRQVEACIQNEALGSVEKLISFTIVRSKV